MDRRWRADPTPTHCAELRLFCLPCAGRGAGMYRRWRAEAPHQLEVCAPELPGRGSRLGETPFRRLAPLVAALADAVSTMLDRPYALFGHSLGGLIAFELARTLRARGARQPAHLFVSGMSAPGTTLTQPMIHCGSDDEVKARLRLLDGTAPDLFDNDQLMALMLPTVRADFSVLETYEYREQPPLAVPITVLSGIADPVVRPATLAGWRRQSTRGSQLRLLPGGHFFLDTALPEVMATIADALRLPAPAAAATPTTAAPVLATAPTVGERAPVVVESARRRP